MDYLETLKADDGLFPWSLQERAFVIKNHPYRMKDGQVKSAEAFNLWELNEHGRLLYASVLDATLAQSFRRIMSF